jgi:hypothetical protein
MGKIRIRGPGWENSDPGKGMGKIRIRDKHPGSGTLYLTKHKPMAPSLDLAPLPQSSVSKHRQALLATQGGNKRG